MCRSDRVRSLVQRLKYFVVAFLLVAVVGSIHAANDISVTALKAGYLRAGENALGQTQWVKRVEFDATHWQQMGDRAERVTKYHTKSSPLSSGTIGSLGRKALRGGVYGIATQIALEQLIDGAGWAFDELQNQVKAPGGPQDELAQKIYCIPDGESRRCANAMGQLLGAATQIYATPPSFKEPCSVIPHPFTTEAMAYGCTTTDGSGVALRVTEMILTRPGPTWPDNHLNDNPSLPPVSVSDEDLGDRIRENPGLVNQLLTDPRTGRPMDTPELRAMIDDLKEEIRNREGFDPQDPTDPTDLEDDTAKPNEGTEWPGFCSWATVVCDWIEWSKETDTEDEPVDVPWEESPIVESTWSAGLGGGSCPSDYSFSVSVAGHSSNIVFGYGPICSFATAMRPVVYAMSLLVAAFIVAGLRNNKGA